MNARTILGWVLVFAAAIAAAFALQSAGVLAAWFLGPCFVGVIAGVTGWFRGRVVRGVSIAAQAPIGLLIANTLVPQTLTAIAGHLPALLFAIVGTLAASTVAAFVLARVTNLGAATAAWGTTPGGATAAVTMSDQFGADGRLVAFMQYSRLLLVTLTASAVAHIVSPHAAVGFPHVAHAGPQYFAIFETFAIAVVGTLLFLRLGVNGAGLLGPLSIGGALHIAGLVQIVIPDIVLHAAYAAVGVGIGLRFTRETVGHAVRAMPAVGAATFALIAACAGFASILHLVAGIDLWTAYLATSPGGLDSIALIAIGSHADMGLVLAMQAIRLVAVVVLGPPIAKRLTRMTRGVAPNTR